MGQNRREWFAGLGALAAPAVQAATYKPLRGVQLYVWTQQFNARKIPLVEGVKEALPAVKRAGYKRVSLTSNFFEPPALAVTLATLRETGLELCDAYNGGPMHEAEAPAKPIAKTVEYARIARDAGCRSFTFNATPIGKPKTDEQLAIQAKNLNVLGEKIHALKMTLGIHQHAPEMKDNAREWRHELRQTNPKLVGMCLDIDWVKRGGQDVMTLLKETDKRLVSVHLRSARNGVWMEEFGDGDVNYSEVAAYLKQRKWSGVMLVELAYEKTTNPTRGLEEDLRRSREYAEKIFG